MIRARKALMRHAISFFEYELMGLFRWGVDTSIFPPERNNEIDDAHPLRENVFGKHQEIVKIKFGAWFLTLQSPNVAPPVGKAILSGRAKCEGEMDHDTWKRMGEIIRSAESSNECEQSTAGRSEPAAGRGADPIPGWGT